MKNTGDPSKSIGCDEISKETKSKLSLVFFGEPKGKSYDMYINAATKLNHAAEKFTYFHVADKDCNPGMNDSIFLMREGEKSQLYKGQYDLSDFLKWLEDN